MHRRELPDPGTSDLFCLPTLSDMAAAIDESLPAQAGDGVLNQLLSALALEEAP